MVQAIVEWKQITNKLVLLHKSIDLYWSFISFNIISVSNRNMTQSVGFDNNIIDLQNVKQALTYI